MMMMMMMRMILPYCWRLDSTVVCVLAVSVKGLGSGLVQPSAGRRPSADLAVKKGTWLTLGSKGDEEAV